MNTYGLHSANCSCTGCVYRSRSKQPNVQQIIQGGSEIDKLFYGKFLPLRERKLLEKLIRTRDVYDDVRNQLLSSESSDQTSPRHKKKKRNDLSPEQSSAVLEMVKLVDRGKMGSANASKLNSCCSCCSCETLRKIRKRMKKDEQRHPCIPHRHIVKCEDIAKYCAEAEERGRKRRQKLSTKISSKISSKVGIARMKIKKLKKHLSEPCLCTSSLSSGATRPSKAVMKKNRSKKKATETAKAPKVVRIDNKVKVARVSKYTHDKVKIITSRTLKDIGSELRSSRPFRIKKDSILLFKEKLLRKRPYHENQDVECEPEICVENECIPEECLVKIKAKGVGDSRKRKFHTRHSDTGRDKSHISVMSRTKKPKARESQILHRPTTKSSYTITTILKTQEMASKSDIEGRRSVSPKQRRHIEKGTVKKEKAIKSIASMTSIPKKAKAQLTIKDDKIAPESKSKAKQQSAVKEKVLEEKITAQLSPKSKLAHISCECKASTKSTPSLTSVPKEKASQTRPKSIKTLKTHEMEHASHKEGRQKHRRESYETLKEGDLPEHVKAKKEKRMKPTHGRIKQRRKYQLSKTQMTGASSKASQESASQTSEKKGRKNLPSAKQCEPLMCIPYECDPEKCAQILLSRSKSRGHSAMKSMDRLRRKSVGSAAFSQKTSRSRSKSKHNQSKSAETVLRKPKLISKEEPHEIVEQNVGKRSNVDRQAVKISSSFSFNVEFYKDTFPDDCACEVRDDVNDFVSGHPEKIKQKKHRRQQKDRGTEYIASEHNMSSESRSSRSFKNVQVGHKLKRCFCALKLKPKKKQKLTRVVSKKTMVSLHNKDLEIGARLKRTQTKLSGIAYSVSPAASTQASLPSYKCEPKICIPGECIPYECAERVKLRNRRVAKHVSKETNTNVTPTKSKVAFTPQPVSKSTLRKTQPGDNRKIKQKRKHSQSPRIESKVSSDESERQAVRIGSNFNFSIEFSKTNTRGDETANTFISDKPIKKGMRHLKQKGIKVHKPRVRHQTSETSKDIKAKQTETETFLQRCLCTLKLLKKNKKKVENVECLCGTWQNKNEYVMHMQNRENMLHKRDRSKLLPYQCEPGFFIPKECDQYIREKLMKLHQMKLQYKNSNIDLESQSTLGKTSRTVISSKSRNTQSFTRASRHNVKKLNQVYNKINMYSRSKQPVRQVGSNLSLKIQFPKEKQAPFRSKDKFVTAQDSKNIHTWINYDDKDKLNTIGSQQIKRPAYPKSINGEAKHKEQGSNVVSAIKRYFSTLKFQKKSNKSELEDKNDVVSESIATSYPLKNSRMCDYKSTCSRLSKLPYGLSSHERAPNFSISGMCDPYECYGKSKRPVVKGLHEHYFSTRRRERKSVTSVTTSDVSGSVETKSQSASRFLKHKTKEDQKIMEKQRDMNDFSPSPQAVRKGSNFSFDKKLSKKRFVPYSTIKNRVQKSNIVSEISTDNRFTERGTKVKRVTSNDSQSQANNIRRLNKASNVGLLLKRCFCTLGLQKKNILKPKFRWQQPITAQFVEVEHHNNKINRQEITKSRRKVLNKTLRREDLSELKLPEDEIFIGNQNGMNVPNKCSRKYLSKSSSSSKQGPHKRSRIDFSFDKMRRLLSTQKINPFYKSFFALNVRVSKSNNIPHSKYRTHDDNRSKSGTCSSNVCDPVDCIKRVKNLKRSNLCGTIGEKANLDCYERCKEEFNIKNKKKKKSKVKPLLLGTDVSVKAGVYKDTDPYQNRHRKALRLGSDVNVNFDFFKEPPRRNICFTGPVPDGKTAKVCGGDPKAPEETKKKAAGISLMIERCVCAAKFKKYTKSDEAVKDHRKYRSTTRLAKSSKSLKSKGVQYKDVPPHKSSHRSTDKNNVRFCTNVNCVEYYHDGNKQKGRGDGDVGKRDGKSTIVNKCLCALQKPKKKEKKLNFVTKCYCTLQKLTESKQLKPTKSMAEIREQRKACKYLDQAEREMETIMAYSKKKFKLRDSQSKLPEYTNDMTDTNNTTDTAIASGSCKRRKNIKHKKSKDGAAIHKPDQRKVCDTCKIICPVPKVVRKDLKAKCMCKESRRGGMCPVCKAITTGKKPKNLKKLPCTCVDPIDAAAPDSPETPPEEVKPLFEMTVNEHNMKILNKNQLLQNLETAEITKETKGITKSGKVCAVTMSQKRLKTYNTNVPWGGQSIHLAYHCCVEHDHMHKKRNKLNTAKKGDLMEVIIDKKNANIINSEQVVKRINKPFNADALKAKANKQKKDAAKELERDCKCCYCRGMKKGPKQLGRHFATLNRQLKPCVCGSVVCKKDWEKIRQEQKSQAAVKVKTCVCGSNVCAEESSKMPDKLLEQARQAEHLKATKKQAILKEKLYQKGRKKRAKENKIALKKRIKQTKKDDKAEMKSIKKNVAAGDVTMVAESLIDLGTFGSKVFCDVARYLIKGMMHPRDLLTDVKDASSDPGGAMKTLQKSAEGIGLFGTAGRIKQRFLKMPSTKSALSALESNPTTNYMVHIADKDPRKRMKKFKTKRTKEPMDFECSTYMASMRKRPCLRIYYMCPWFYPHCMGLLQLWKQLMDVLLFIFAVVVWSPCILCMELCRGCVCCFMCQG